MKNVKAEVKGDSAARAMLVAIVKGNKPKMLKIRKTL